MKTKEELNALKDEVETVSKKLHELTDEELAQVAGGKYVTGNCGVVVNVLFHGNCAKQGSALSSDNICKNCPVLRL